MTTASLDRAGHGPFETMEAAFAWWVENHEAPPLSTVTVGGTFITRRASTMPVDQVKEFGFSGVAAETVPDDDDDSEVIVGMERTAAARAAAESLPEYRFGRPVPR